MDFPQKRVVSTTKGKVHRLAPFAKKVETRYDLCTAWDVSTANFVFAKLRTLLSMSSPPIPPFCLSSAFFWWKLTFSHMGAFMCHSQQLHRLLAEQTLFCDTIMQALALTDEDMGAFNSDYVKNKAEQGRLLKAKFSVSALFLDVAAILHTVVCFCVYAGEYE